MQKYILPVVMLVLAGALQGNVPQWMTMGGAKPDILLVALIATSLTLDPVAGGVLGFTAGVLHGSIVGVDLGSYIISRTIIGFLAGMVTVRFFSDNPIVPVLSAGVLTLMGESFFLLSSPPSDLPMAMHKILFTSLFNSLLTLFAFWFMRWIQMKRKIKRAAARV